MPKGLPVREHITYPVVQVTAGTNSCRDEISQFHHVLNCGHLITTAKPDEGCAPNCFHVAVAKTSRKPKKKSMEASLGLSFYCDACVEVTNERRIAATLSNQEAGELHCRHGHFYMAANSTAEGKRVKLRRKEALKQEKDSKFRKCYIAKKITSVPCDEDGSIVSSYLPATHGHPFDTALPRTGTNMFEDVDITPQRKNLKRQGPLKKPTSVVMSSDQEEELSDDVDNTVAEGLKWVREDRERVIRQDQESLQRQRAAARPIINSSPSTDLSSFITANSSPLPAQTSSPSVVDSPRTTARHQPSTKRRRTPGEIAIAPEPRPSKKTKAAPRAP